MKYLIFNPIPPSAAAHHAGGGFAVNNPIEGWIFTVLESAATRFDTVQEAEKIIKVYYAGDSNLIVQEE